MLLKRIEKEASIIESYYDSSNVLKSIYHKNTRDLDVVFKSGSVYRYREVSMDTLIQMEKEKSQGNFLNTVIKTKHPATKVVNVNTLQLIEHIQTIKDEQKKG